MDPAFNNRRLGADNYDTLQPVPVGRDSEETPNVATITINDGWLVPVTCGL